ncbi:MAG: hypothetical protein ACI9B9_002414, partial [Halioglobus sp.]
RSLRPELIVIKILLIGLSAGVVNILNIDKNADFFQWFRS